jgi:hypothetical protein
MAPMSELGALAFYCNPGALRVALRAGADPNAIDVGTGRTPLMWLCEMHDSNTKARKRMFRLLMDAGASLEQRDAACLTAWHYASYGAARSFRNFVKAEYKRRLGSLPSRTFKRSEVSGGGELL